MRYAIYFTPPSFDPLTLSGSLWLGRDAFAQKNFAIPTDLRAIVATPARYGFHATIKAPFELADRSTADELQTAFKAYCETATLLTLPPITVAYRGNSFILELESESAELQALAADIVHCFEPLRAPLSEKDIARRKPDQLTKRQRFNLQQWGYPHVMDDFRFHMTLTGHVQEEDRASVKAHIIRHFAEFLGKPLTFSGLGLFVEPARGESFHVLDWQSFKA